MSELEKQVVNEMEEALNYSSPSYSRGELVEGVVVQISDDNDVLVDIKWKSEGIIPINELAPYRVEDAREIVSEGDKIEAEIVKIDDNEGKIILSRRKALAIKAWDELAEKYDNGENVTGIVKEVVKGGLLIDLGVRAFLPASLVDVAYTESLDEYLGQNIEAKIIELDQEKGKLVLSRKVILEEEREKLKESLWNSIEEGKTRKGIVRRLTKFGAFVDLGGVDGLLHVSEMAWFHVKDPSEIVKIGDEIEVFILKVDKNKERISLGLKQITSDPWQNILEKYPLGSIVAGKVVRIAPFGAFVELEPGVDGLIHLSQLSDKRVAKADDVVNIGEEVKVKVIDIKEDEKKIGLSIKEISEDEEASKVEDYLNQQQDDDGVVLGDVFGDMLKDK